MLRTKVLAKIKTYILFSTTFFPEILSVYETVMWKYMAEPNRPRMTAWRMRCSSCIRKTLDTHSEIDIFLTVHHELTYQLPT